MVKKFNIKKQTKATDHHQLNISGDTVVYASIKKDGVYLQIHKEGDNVAIFTSSGKRLNIASIEDIIRFNVRDSEIVLECEYVYKSRSDADNELKKLHKKGGEFDGKLWIFDVVNDLPFKNRLQYMTTYFLSCATIACNDRIDYLEYIEYSYNEVLNVLSGVVEKGEEGLMLKMPNHTHTGKKSKLAIKVKPIKTADLIVTNIAENGYITGEDKQGVEAKFKVAPNVLYMLKIGSIVEVAYDYIGNKYNQARFLDFRNDKEIL